jgi:hypothetical protein
MFAMLRDDSAPIIMQSNAKNSEKIELVQYNLLSFTKMRVSNFI